MDTGFIISAGVATSALLLSVGNTVQRFRDRQPYIRTMLTLGTVTLVSENPLRALALDGRAGNPPPRDLILTAVNTGQRVVTLGGLGLLLPNNTILPLTPVTSTSEIPYHLAADESFHVWWPAHDVAHRLVAGGFTGTIQLAGYYVDQRGRRYRTKRAAFDINEWGAAKGAKGVVSREHNEE